MSVCVCVRVCVGYINQYLLCVCVIQYMPVYRYIACIYIYIHVGGYMHLRKCVHACIQIYACVCGVSISSMCACVYITYSSVSSFVCPSAH